MIALIVYEKYLDRELVCDNSLKLLKVHHYTSVALKTYCFFSSCRDAKTYRCGKTISHAGYRVVYYKSRAFFYYPALVARYAARTVTYCSKTSLRKCRRKSFDKSVYINLVIACMELFFGYNRIFFLPYNALFSPCICRRNISVFALICCRIELFKKFFCVSVNLHINMNSVLLHLGRFNVDHYDLGSSCPCSPCVADLSD